MKERPILFSAPMVRAILDGRKTQTRRIVKPQPKYYAHSGVLASADASHIFCPYGEPGDMIWVRETFCQTEGGTIIYRADGGKKDAAHVLKDDRWRPSIHMPRWASRILLEIVSVRVERLIDIPEMDAQQEGYPPGATDKYGSDYMSFREWFEDLWNSINGERSFEQNPWVWVVEFKRVSQCP